MYCCWVTFAAVLSVVVLLDAVTLTGAALVVTLEPAATVVAAGAKLY